MAMRAECPRDGHGRFLVGRRAGLLVRREGVLTELGGNRLNCSDKACRCADCQRALSEQERKDWPGPP